ncbi:hypothetical protein BX265_1778 [Streptomyces sp. TLI_235]|nr:hypothetical protein BX265_1778 [Streptomyces sp. TLI_235]
MVGFLPLPRATVLAPFAATSVRDHRPREENTQLSEASAADVDQPAELQFQRCTWCGSAQPRRSLICRVCRNDQFRWEWSSGLGQVVTPPAIGRYSATAHQFTVIQLDEGPLINGTVLGAPLEQLWAGARVRFRFDKHTSELPVFELADWD